MRKRHIQSKWTDRDAIALNGYWHGGFTAREIGKYLGRTKNEVLGKRHRMIAAGEWSGSPREYSNTTRATKRRITGPRLS